MLRVPRFCFSFFSPENFLVPGNHIVPALPPEPLPGTAARGAEFAQSALACWLWVLFPALPLKMNTGSVPLPEVGQGGCESCSLLPAGHFSPPGSLLNKANKPQLFPAQGAPCLQRIPKPRFRGLGFFRGTPETAPFLGGLRGCWRSRARGSSPLPKSLFLPSQNPSFFQASSRDLTSSCSINNVFLRALLTPVWSLWGSFSLSRDVY